MTSALELAQIGLALSTLYFAGLAIYNILVHPLRKFPGPLSHRLSGLPRAWYSASGSLPFHVRELHRRYGPVVRIAPDELAFCSVQAWRDIYGQKKGSELPKYEGFYNVFDQSPRSIMNAGTQEHGSLRHQLSPSFSDRSMHKQEPIIGSYVSLLVARLKAAIQENSCQNLRAWYNWTTFDLIGDLSFGVEGGFGCLQQSKNHPWIELMESTVVTHSKLRALYRLGFGRPMAWIYKLGLLKDKRLNVVSDKVGERLKSPQRPDFLEELIQDKNGLGLDHAHLAMTATVLIVAGSETTATLLSGATHFLTLPDNSDVLKKLEKEVRSAFARDEDITLTSVNNLPYMLACLNESLRCYPPVPTGLPRQVPRGGAMIDGHFVPQGTLVSVFQWAINYDERFWTEPEKFTPDRWLGDPKYKDDQHDAMQSFSVGPRNCIGRNLAYAEMRLVLAKIIYNFDISAAGSDRDWLSSQNAYDTFWGDVPDLNIQLKPVVRTTPEEGQEMMDEKAGEVVGEKL